MAKQSKLKALKKGLSPHKVVIATVSVAGDNLIISTSQPVEAFRNLSVTYELVGHDMSKSGIDSYIFIKR